MSPKKFLFVVAFVAVVAAGVIWLRLGRADRTASGEFAVLQLQRHELEAEVRLANEELMALRKSLDDVERTFIGAKAPPVATIAPQSPTPNSVVQASTDPQLGAITLKLDRISVRWEYDRLYRALGLSPTQIEQFEQVHIDHRHRTMDLTAIGYESDEATKRASETLAEKAKEEFEARRRELLGGDGYRQLLEYERIRGIRNSIVGALAGAAAYHDVPITVEQARRLTEAAVQAGGENSSPDALRAIDWETFQARARQILSPAQYHVMRYVYMPSGYRGLRQLHLENLVKRAVEVEAGGSGPARQ